MDAATKDYLSEHALSLYRSWQADEEYTVEDRRCLHFAYSLLSLLSHLSGDAGLLARCLNRSPHTIFEYVGVLEAAGVPIKRDRLPNGKDTGRPITIFSIATSEGN